MPTILVADDNSNIQKMVSLALKDEGLQIIAVGNGEAAVRKMRESAPDLVLADIFMPVRNGYEVCEYVKRDPKLSHIPVVLLTGAFDPFDEREAQRVGADAVLKKPFVPPDPLVNLVKSLLEKIVAAQLVAAGNKGEFVSNKVADSRPAAPVGVAVPPAPRRAEARRPEGRRSAPAPAELRDPETLQPEGRQAETATTSQSAETSVQDFSIAADTHEAELKPTALDQLLATATAERVSKAPGTVGGFAAWPSLVANEPAVSDASIQTTRKEEQTTQYWPPKTIFTAKTVEEKKANDGTLEPTSALDLAKVAEASAPQAASLEGFAPEAKNSAAAVLFSPDPVAESAQEKTGAAPAMEIHSEINARGLETKTTRPSPFDWLEVSSAAVEPPPAELRSEQSQRSDESSIASQNSCDPPAANSASGDAQIAAESASLSSEDVAVGDEADSKGHDIGEYLEHDFSQRGDHRAEEFEEAAVVEGFAAAVPAGFDEPAPERSAVIFQAAPLVEELAPVEASYNRADEAPVEPEAPEYGETGVIASVERSETPTSASASVPEWAVEPAPEPVPYEPVSYAEPSTTELKSREPRTEEQAQGSDALTPDRAAEAVEPNATADPKPFGLAEAVQAAAKEELNSPASHAGTNHDAVQMSPELVENITSRIIERMQPQLLEMIQREVLRPVVEALVQRELSGK
ncbi:MAG TPA: response regulator [Candidatus Acidoferrales bacterium]|nr:response regulator [Candidatus Acidoferrales bacterium]